MAVDIEEEAGLDRAEMNEKLLAREFLAQLKIAAIDAYFILRMVDLGDLALDGREGVGQIGAEIDGLAVALELPEGGHGDVVPCGVVKAIGVVISANVVNALLPVEFPFAVQRQTQRRLAALQRRLRGRISRRSVVPVLLVLLYDVGILPVFKLGHVIPSFRW